jgi:flagellar biosynthesis protein FliQ
MTTETVIALLQQLFLTALLVSLPVLAVSLVIGLVVSIFQTVTSIQDQTLSYVPRIVAAGLAIVFTLGFTLQLAVEFFQRMMMAAADGGHK